MDNNTIWKIIDSQFEETPQHLVLHHIESYNDFFNKDIYEIFRNQNPLKIVSAYDANLGDYKHKCNLYFGGKSGKRIYYGKPVIQDKDGAHYMYPNEARLRNMTYAMTIHYDVEVEFVDLLEPGEEPYEIGPEFLVDDAASNDLVGGGQKFTGHEFTGHKFTGGFADDVEHGGGDLSVIDNFTEEHDKKAFNESISYKSRGGLPLDQFELLDQEGGGKEKGDADKDKNGDKPKNKKKRGQTEEVANVAAIRKQLQLTPELAKALREALAKSLEQGEDGRMTQRRILVLPNIYLGRFPVMVQSDYCILKGMSREVRHGFGECRNDNGGYFIVQGKEKTVIIQEKFGDNMLYLRKGEIYKNEAEADEETNIFNRADKEELVENPDKYLFSIEIKSVSENVSKPKRTLSVQLLAPGPRFSNMNIVVNIPNVRAPVPLFIVFRALGVISDHDIIETCLLDMKKYEFMVDSFAPSVHDAGIVFDQDTALKYIAELTKYHNTNYALEVLSDYFLPHVGELCFKEKALFLGHMVFRLLCAQHGLEIETDRDNLRYKRVELFGVLFRELFNEYYSEQLKHIYREFDKRIYFNNNQYEHDLVGLITGNYGDIFSTRFVDEGVRRAFRGGWGGKEHTKRVGIVQDLNRLSFSSALSHLRKMNLPLDASVKVVGPRVLHNSHWGYIDPIDTPDGGNIGIHKTMAMPTYISRGYSREKMVAWLKKHTDMRPVADMSPRQLADYTKVFVNGHWCGSISDPIVVASKFRLYRRNALIPLHTSISFDMRQNAVFIYTDAGRICRPIFYKDEVTGKLSFEVSAEIRAKLEKGDFKWSELVAGFNPKREDVAHHINDVQIRELAELYALSEQEAKATGPAEVARFIKNKSVVEYVDPNEVEHSLIALSQEAWEQNPKKHRFYTHMEIHHSYLFGTMCNQVILPENNPAVRISFSCSQSRQACSIYHTNYHNRMDKTAVVLNTPQIPLLKSRYYKHLHNEENNYGENVIVAIMCLNGYNVEDAILVNQASLDRGLFRTTYYTSYQAHEEKEVLSGSTSGSETDYKVKAFTQIGTDETVTRLMPGHDYSKLDANGLIRENTPVNDQTILIGLAASNSRVPGVKVDDSIPPKKGQVGVVDRAFITVGEEGERIAKVRVRETRVPNLGDKMASRAGQKGTVGMVVAEADMPFTRDGLKPDLIINPHALPTRQTIGHLVECLIGKVGLQLGAFNDCTAFNNEGSKAALFGRALTNTGMFHSSGNEIFYDGTSGRQIEMEIFVGPNYYMRLKHMVKDKINYRAKGPRSALTKQTVGGRANDGGLRIGEMERDVLIAHGINNFLTESMMERGDEYQMAICNKTGLMAIYNPAKKLFLSPGVDGPLRFHINETDRSISLTTVSQFGRNFSVVSIPYSMKLLMQELQAVGIFMRIVTEDNIDQIESMGYSNNIKTLTFDSEMTPKKLAEMMKAATKELPIPKERPHSQHTPTPPSPPPGSPPGSPSGSPPGSPSGSPPGSPPGQPPGSPKYNPGTPEYNPPDEPEYYPEMKGESPPYPSESPPYPQEETTPPADTNQTGGGKNHAHGASTNDFTIGDQVYFRNSADLQIADDQIWTITKKGNRLLTIQCPPEFVASTNHGEYIQMAKPNELIKVNSPEGIQFRQLKQRLMSSNLNPTPSAHPASSLGQMATNGVPPTIQVAPVIKIMNGNNNTMKDEPTETTNGTQLASAEPSFTEFMGGTSHGASPKKSKEQKGGDAAAAQSSDSSSFGKGLADFGKLIINKLT